LVAAFLTFMIVLALIQTPSLVKKRQWRDFAAYCTLWLLAAVYGTLELAEVDVPSPVELIIGFFEALSLKI